MSHFLWHSMAITPENLIEQFERVLKNLEKTDISKLDPKVVDSIYNNALAIIARCDDLISERNQTIREAEDAIRNKGESYG